MNKILVVAWLDPIGEQRVTDKLTFDGANYYPVIERCPKAFALVYSNQVNEKMRARAIEYANEKRQDFKKVEVYIMADSHDVLDIAKKRIA